MSPEARLAEFAASPWRLPPAARGAAERLLADTLKVGAAGAASEAGRRVAGMAAPGPCRLLAGGTASAADAAFANGFAIHCLEWDAVHEEAVVHALSVVTAAVLALSDRCGGSEADALVDAVVTGVEIAAGLGLSASGPMRFFRPGTAGIIGAALAGARLLGLGPDRCEPLLGLAYSFAAGTMQAHAEGSIVLPLQIAAAARSAVTAVDLAAAGFDGPRQALSGPFGYGALIEPLDLERWLPNLGERWLVEEVSIKPWPCGRASHGLLTAILASGLRAEEVRRVTAFVPPLVQRLVGRPPEPPMTPSYARLCGPYLAALMLKEGLIDPRRFVQRELANPELLALAAKVTIELDSNADHNALVPQRFVVEGAKGATEIALAATLGSPAQPLSPEQEAERNQLLGEIAGRDAEPIFADPLTFASSPR